MANEWSELPEGLNAAARELVGELRAGKEAAGLSLARLGALTHYSRSSWDRWLNGRRLLTEDALAGFVRATGADGALLARLLAEASLAGGPAGDGPEPASAAGKPDEEAVPAGAGGPRSRARAPVLAQLPASVADFTGRRSQVEAMLEALLPAAGPARDRAGETCVVVVSGGGGVGKTTLAVHVAHRAAARYPDGALYADLRGTDPGPRDPADVLAGWLRELGEDPAGLPAGLEDRAARFRSLLRDRALLVLLDNARDAAQIRPLIPAAGRSAVVVTSRARLGHLPASRRIELEPMMYHEALSLLEKVAGAARLAREPQATGVVLDACAGLPLALRICAARLETRPGWSVRVLADRIVGEHRRLDELSVGDLALRTSFDMSYAQLAEDAAETGRGRLLSPARAFRLLGLATVPDLELSAAAALLGADDEEAEQALETLVNVYLLESPAPRRYHFHDLLRIYAAEKAELEPRAAGDEALRRLGEWYVHAAYQAVATLDVNRPPQDAPAAPPDRPEVRFADSAEALTWLDAERDNLGAVARLADRHGLHAIAIRLPAVTTHYHNLRGRWTELGELSELSLRNARAAGDRAAEAQALGALGWARYHEHEHRRALELLDRALSIYQELGSAIGQSSTLDRMGTVSNAAGDLDAALTYQERSVEQLREVGDERIALTATTNLALTYAMLGRVEAFFGLCEQLLPEVREARLGFAVAPLLEAAGEMHLMAGHVPEALAALAESVEVYSGVGNRPGLADAQEHLGEARLAAGDRERALADWQRALAIFELCDVPRAEALRVRIRELEVGGGARRGSGC